MTGAIPDKLIAMSIERMLLNYSSINYYYFFFTPNLKIDVGFAEVNTGAPNVNF